MVDLMLDIILDSYLLLLCTGKLKGEEMNMFLKATNLLTEPLDTKLLPSKNMRR